MIPSSILSSVTVLLLLITAGVSAQPAASPQADAAGVARIAERMREFVARNETAGAVMLVGRRDRVLYLECVGRADISGNQAMKPDAIFWIASMTKPITATAILMLQEEGKLSVEDPVGKYLPELANLKTADGRPARLTLRHLLTHTSGLAEATQEEERKARTLADLIPHYAARPVAFEPGSRWQYCQSGMNSLGRIVEIVSGQSFPEFLQKRLFGPLGMKDTTFYLTEEQLPRLAKPYAPADGKLDEVPISLPTGGHSPTFRERYPAANGGLYSTASDYARFARMILNGGELDGKRYLKGESVRLMTSVHTGELTTGFTDGNGWGLGWCVVRQPQGVTAMLSPGTFGHGGAWGTQAWIDPEKGIIYILMVQRANIRNGDASEVRRVFQATAAATFAR